MPLSNSYPIFIHIRVEGNFSAFIPNSRAYIERFGDRLCCMKAGCCIGRLSKQVACSQQLGCQRYCRPSQTEVFCSVSVPISLVREYPRLNRFIHIRNHHVGYAQKVIALHKVFRLRSCRKFFLPLDDDVYGSLGAFQSQIAVQIFLCRIDLSQVSVFQYSAGLLG